MVFIYSGMEFFIVRVSDDDLEVNYSIKIGNVDEVVVIYFIVGCIFVLNFVFLGFNREFIIRVFDGLY